MLSLVKNVLNPTNGDDLAAALDNVTNNTHVDGDDMASAAESETTAAGSIESSEPGY